MPLFNRQRSFQFDWDDSLNDFQRQDRYMFTADYVETDKIVDEILEKVRWSKVTHILLLQKIHGKNAYRNCHTNGKRDKHRPTLHCDH